MSLALQSRRSRYIVLVGVLFSIFFLVLAGRRLDWSRVADAMRSADLLPWILLSVLSYLAGQVVRGIRTKMLVSREARLSTLTASNIVVIGYAFNNIFPARMGELARAGMLAERTGISFTQSLTITFLERVLDGLVILLLFVAATFVIPVSGWIAATVQVATLVFGAAGLAVLVAVVSPHYLTAVTSRLSARFSPFLHDTAIRLASSITRGVAYLQNPRDALAVGVLSVAVWLLEAAMFLCVLPIFGLPAQYEVAVLAMAITNLGILVPSSPGFIGPFHFFCMQTLVTLGVAEATAISYAIVVHLAFYIPITLWGVAATMWYGIELGSTAAMAREAKSLPSLSEVLDVDLQVLSSSRVRVQELPPSPFLVALTEALLPLEAIPLSEAERRAAVTRTAEFVTGQVESLPAQLRVLFSVGMTGFRFVVRLLTLRGFCDLPVEKRTAIVRWWAFGPIGLTRQLFRMPRSTALLAFYEQASVQAAMDRARTGAGTIAV